MNNGDWDKLIWPPAQPDGGDGTQDGTQQTMDVIEHAAPQDEKEPLSKFRRDYLRCAEKRKARRRRNNKLARKARRRQ